MGALRYYICTVVVLASVTGFYLGSEYVWLGIATFPVLFLLDVLIPQDHRHWKVEKGVLADLVLYLHVFLMFTMYAMFLRWFVVLGGPYNALGELQVGQAIWAFLSLAWISAVPNLPISHELMHRTHWYPLFCNRLLNTFYMDTNRDIGHIITHHIHLDTPDDCDTPQRGQRLYGFLWQASKGAYLDAFRSEIKRLDNRGKSAWHFTNKTYSMIVLMLALPGSMVLVSGDIVAGYITVGAMFLAKLIVEAFNYHQHYGLVRVPGEPVKVYHAWNHLGAIVRPIGVEITNHINHHEDSYVPFYALKPHPEGACMPSLFVCFVASLIPPIWFKFIIKPKLEHWDNTFASEAEKELARAANEKAGWPKWV